MPQLFKPTQIIGADGEPFSSSSFRDEPNYVADLVQVQGHLYLYRELDEDTLMWLDVQPGLIAQHTGCDEARVRAGDDDEVNALALTYWLPVWERVLAEGLVAWTQPRPCLPEHQKLLSRPVKRSVALAIIGCSVAGRSPQGEWASKE